MSSILTALKKLESDDFKEQEIRKLSRRMSHGTSSPLRWIILVSSVIGILVPAVFWGITRLNNQEKPVAGIPAIPTPESIESRVRSNKEEKIAVPEKTPPTPKKPTMAMVAPAPPLKPSSEAAPVSAAEALRSMPPIPEPMLKPAPAPAPEPQTGKQRLVLEEEITHTVSGDPKWDLQAIAWSSDPQKRIAVINGSVVREGDVMFGNRIRRIDENAVFFENKTETWNLVFRLR